MPKKVLMICLGNICRSPIAEAVFTEIVKQKGLESDWEIDSAAIGAWHVGKQPDPRARDVLKEHNIPYTNRARQIKKQDFTDFDFIFGMDEDNMDDLNRLAPTNSTAQILLLGNSDPEGEKIIRDPYYDNDSKGFVKCYEQCVRCCEAFIVKNTA